jgi:putative sigma-54 modulation protein
MQLNITFRQFGASEALRQHAQERVERVSKYLDAAGEAHVVLSLERKVHHVDITVRCGAWTIRGCDKSENMYASIDMAMDKIERQLRRHKEKVKRHHGDTWVHHQQALVQPMREPPGMSEALESEALAS